ncbi:MAG TPA: sensor histidine kinase [Clostridia bacterium]|nr:sensor histidine kinase [Clostridia bacterium]
MRELSLHVLDLMENSKAAGARTVWVSVEEDLVRDLLTIEVRDDGKGMSQDQAQAALDPFVTSRTTRKVGLGLPLFLAAARRCEGDLTIESEAGKGTCVRAWFRRSHIDRAPIGDMAGTIATFSGLNPMIRTVYSHKVTKKASNTQASDTQREFRFDSYEVVKYLGEDSRVLQNPEVINWMRCHCEEGIRNLYGGEGE